MNLHSLDAQLCGLAAVWAHGLLAGCALLSGFWVLRLVSHCCRFLSCACLWVVPKSACVEVSRKRHPARGCEEAGFGHRFWADTCGMRRCSSLGFSFIL